MKTKSRSSVSHVVEWDDLIQLAEEQIQRQTRKLIQLEALRRLLLAQRARGDECPVTPALEATRDHLARIAAELTVEERAQQAGKQAAGRERKRAAKELGGVLLL